MVASKTIFFYVCIILLIGVIAVFAEESSSATAAVDEGLKGNCSCGGFPTATPAVNDAPILSQTPGLVVKCDDEGENTCKNLCNALAIATKAKGPEILCNKLKEANELKLSAFFSICEKPWTYADITAEEPLCCADSKVKVCPSIEHLTATPGSSGDLPAEAKPVV